MDVCCYTATDSGAAWKHWSFCYRVNLDAGIHSTYIRCWLFRVCMCSVDACVSWLWYIMCISMFPCSSVHSQPKICLFWSLFKHGIDLSYSDMCTICLQKILMWQIRMLALKAELVLTFSTSQSSTLHNTDRHAEARITSMHACVRKQDQFASARLIGHLRWSNKDTNRGSGRLSQNPLSPCKTAGWIIPFVIHSCTNLCRNSLEYFLGF